MEQNLQQQVLELKAKLYDQMVNLEKQNLAGRTAQSQLVAITRALGMDANEASINDVINRINGLIDMENFVKSKEDQE